MASCAGYGAIFMYVGFNIHFNQGFLRENMSKKIHWAGAFVTNCSLQHWLTVAIKKNKRIS